MAVLPHLLYSADKINALQFEILNACGLMLSSECKQICCGRRIVPTLAQPAQE